MGYGDEFGVIDEDSGGVQFVSNHVVIAPSIVRASDLLQGGSFTNSFNVTVVNGVAVGHRAIIVLWTNTSTVTLNPSASDTYGNSYSAAILNNIDSNLAMMDAVITHVIPPGGIITIAIPGSGGSAGAGVIVYDASSFTGASGADTFGNAGGFVGTLTATTSGNLSALDFVFEFGNFGAGATLTSYDSNFHGLDNLSTGGYNGFAVTQWKTQVAGATSTGVFHISGSEDSGTIIAGYKL